MHKMYQLMLNKILTVVILGDWIWEDFFLFFFLYLSSYFNKC